MVQFGKKSHHFGRISFQGLQVISKWMLLNLKSHFLARNNTVLAKCCFKLKIEQNPVFKKELYSMGGFNGKRFCQKEMVKNWATRCFQPKKKQNTVLKKDVYFMSGFNAKLIF